ncbi:MAG TPA: hypothetical protein VKC15_09140, partial [Gemmatimonadales bacterium]|nr:hypothetical protein [Gemmatimonadales bacterium]
QSVPHAVAEGRTMSPAVFLIALLSTLGIGALTIVKVARLITTRRQLPAADVAERLEELERSVQGVQQELAETQERLDFAERLLSAAREQRRIGG